MASAAWEKVRAPIGGLWRKAHPERVDTVRAELAETRTEVLVAREAGDEAVERELVVEWQGRLRRLLAATITLDRQIFDMALDRAGRILAVGTDKNQTHLFSLADLRRPVETAKWTNSRSNSVNGSQRLASMRAAARDPDPEGEILALAEDDGTVQLVSDLDGQPRAGD